jgi:hypothetical protein
MIGAAVSYGSMHLSQVRPPGNMTTGASGSQAGSGQNLKPNTGVGLNDGNSLNNAKYAQNDYSSNFSKKGQEIYSDLAGQPIKSVNDLTSALKNGTVNPVDVPVNYIVRDGNTLINLC